MPYITERWPGGMLTNFVTIRKAVKKCQQLIELKKMEPLKHYPKRKLRVDRTRAKLEKTLDQSHL